MLGRRTRCVNGPTTQKHYHRLARDLADKDNGWHLGVVHMKVDQVLDFHIEDMAAHICQLAPELWELVSLTARMFAFANSASFCAPRIFNRGDHNLDAILPEEKRHPKYA
ncbi:hypothetical protein C8Q72DRAFT_839817 [Fomitopsis betulina]|nr:hypothetical protein C8Q72DRAFT_839817 [Fomitopsis betulina]